MAKLTFVITFVAAWTLICSQEICGPNESVEVGDKYIVQNGKVNSPERQCLEVVGNGFRVTEQEADRIAPVYHPSIYFGCLDSACTPNSPLPIQISQLKNVSSKAELLYVDDAVYWSFYEIGLSPDINGSSSQTLSIELNMDKLILQPSGNQTGVISIGDQKWDIWESVIDNQHSISYVGEEPVASVNFDSLDFISDAISRGYYDETWYLTSVRINFLIFENGTDLAVSNFDINVQ